MYESNKLIKKNFLATIRIRTCTDIPTIREKQKENCLQNHKHPNAINH